MTFVRKQMLCWIRGRYGRNLYDNRRDRFLRKNRCGQTDEAGVKSNRVTAAGRQETPVGKAIRWMAPLCEMAEKELSYDVTLDTKIIFARMSFA